MNKVLVTVLSLIVCIYAGRGFMANASLNQPTQAIQISKSLVFAATSIASGQTASAAIPTSGLSLVGVQLPSAFTGTTLTFQISLDGTTYQPVYTTTSGTALSYTVAQGHYVAINPQDFYGANYIKIISGSSEGAARALTIALKGL